MIVVYVKSQKVPGVKKRESAIFLFYLRIEFEYNKRKNDVF